MFQKKETRESSIRKCLAFICVIAICIVMTMPDVSVEAATTKLNTQKISVYVGQTYMLKLHKASGKVTWTTGDKSVATVKKGKVTAVGDGTTVIKAKYHKKTYECTVTVKKPKLNKTKVYLESGETFVLKLKGDKIGKCLVGDSDIVEADWEDTSSSLELSAQSAGTTKITILTEHNTKLYCEVVVTSENEDESLIPNGGDDKPQICTHKWPKEGTVVVPASCNQTGKIEFCCILCDELLEEKTIPKTEHNFCSPEDGIIDKQATCTSDGYSTITCSKCSMTKYVRIPRFGHKYIFKNKVEPTCIRKGYDVSACEYCKNEVRDNYTNVLGHDFSIKNWIGQEKRYDCLKGGVYTLQCSRCNSYKSTSSVEPPTGKHDFKCIKIEQAGNCESPSKHYYECSVCKATQVITKQDVSHTYGEPVVVSPEKSTQRNTGYTKEVCTRCGYEHKYDYTSWVYTPENVKADIQKFMNDVCPPGTEVGVCEDFKCRLLGYLGLYDYLSYSDTDYSNPKPGDVIMWDYSDGRPGHIAVIMEVRGDSLVLAEGNLNEDRRAHYGRTVSKSVINTALEVNGVTCMVTLASAYK